MKNKQIVKVGALSARQRDIYNHWLNKDIDYLMLSCGRQVGKSHVALVIAIKTALKPGNVDSKLEGKPVKVAFIMPYNEGARKMYERALSFVDDKLSGLQKNATRRIIKFANGSEIRFFGAEKETTIRGEYFDFLIIDEACFIKESFFHILLPTILIAKSKGRGKVLLSSTPKEKNWFYDFFMLGINNKEGYKSIKFTSYEAELPDTDPAEVLKHLETTRSVTPKALFDCEYMGEFLDGSRGMFELERIQFLKQGAVTDKHGVTAGIDWGFTNDYTVLVILNVKKEVCYINRWKNIGTHELIPKLVSALKTHGNPFVYAETNGIGSFPTDDLKRVYGAVKGFTTTASNKTEMIMKLANHLLTPNNEDRLRLPDVDYLKEEFENFGFRYENGAMKFGNMKTDVHDDTVMATAIANYHYERFSLSF